MILLLFVHQNLANDIIQWSGCFVGRFIEQSKIIKKCGKRIEKKKFSSFRIDTFSVSLVVVFFLTNRAQESFFFLFLLLFFQNRKKLVTHP